MTDPFRLIARTLPRECSNIYVKSRSNSKVFFLFFSEMMTEEMSEQECKKNTDLILWVECYLDVIDEGKDQCRLGKKESSD